MVGAFKAGHRVQYHTNFSPEWLPGVIIELVESGPRWKLYYRISKAEGSVCLIAARSIRNAPPVRREASHV